MRSKFISDDDLLLKKTLELHNKKMVVKSVFHDDKKCYPQVFLNECFYKL